MKKLVLLKTMTFVVGMGFACSSVSPISNNWAATMTGVGGLAGTAAAYQCAASYAIDVRNPQKSDDAFALLAMAGGALGAGIVTHWIVSYFTPDGRYTRAMDHVGKVKMALWDYHFSSYEELKHYCKMHFNNDWYLVSAKREFLSLKNKLNKAESLLTAAIGESNNNPKLVTQCKELLSDTVPLLAQVGMLIDLVDSDEEEYHHQRKHYEAYLQLQESRRAQFSQGIIINYSL